jgi:hypothetical protein
MQEDILERAFKSYKNIADIDLKLEALRDELDDTGWAWQALSYQIFKECGVFELYCSNDKLNGRFISDLISDAFYQSDSLNEVYDKINGILLEKEFSNGN